MHWLRILMIQATLLWKNLSFELNRMSKRSNEKKKVVRRSFALPCLLRNQHHDWGLDCAGLGWPAVTSISLPTLIVPWGWSGYNDVWRSGKFGLWRWSGVAGELCRHGWCSQASLAVLMSITANSSCCFDDLIHCSTSSSTWLALKHCTSHRLGSFLPGSQLRMWDFEYYSNTASWTKLSPSTATSGTYYGVQQHKHDSGGVTNTQQNRQP